MKPARHATIALAIALAALAAAEAGGAATLTPQRYRVTVETGLPHLEENLRYATTRATLCLGEPQLASAFPILQHVALEGCTLADGHADGAIWSFTLHCAPGSETTGTASWRIDPAGLVGTLDVRLGGKNMTVYQRITGRAVGACAPGD
jgi:hypothetical protein